MTVLLFLLALAGPVVSPPPQRVATDADVAGTNTPKPSPPKAQGPHAPALGPFFVDPPVSEARHGTDPRRGRRYPLFSVGGGTFCFIEDTHCKTSLLLSAAVAAGMRIPASDKGPDIPYAHLQFTAGVTIRPMMIHGRVWHPWGIGIVAGASRGTGSVTVERDMDAQDIRDTRSTNSIRIGVRNQLWLTRRAHAVHLDATLGAVRSDVLTSGTHLWGTHAELGFAWGGFAGLFLGGDFLDQDTRLYLGVRGHGIAAGPILALVISGLAIGGAL